MTTPNPRDMDRPAPGVKGEVRNVDPEDLTGGPIPATDHHAGGGAGVPPRHTIESTGTTGAARRHPRDVEDEGLVGGLTTFQVVAAVSFGAVLAAGIAAAVVALVGNDDDDDEEEEQTEAKPRRKASAAKKPAAKRRAAAGAASRKSGNAPRNSDSPRNSGTPRNSGSPRNPATPRKSSSPRNSGTPRAAGTPRTREQNPRININEADAETLRDLPGVGPAMATAILARRPFASTDQLEEVSGIGPAHADKLKQLTTV